MKKAYAKPMLYAESFQLVEHIADTCAYVTNFGSDCPIYEAGVAFFRSAEAGCNADGMSMITFAGLDLETVSVEQIINVVKPTCYNSFADFTQLFTSA